MKEKVNYTILGALAFNLLLIMGVFLSHSLDFAYSAPTKFLPLYYFVFLLVVCLITYVNNLDGKET